MSNMISGNVDGSERGNFGMNYITQGDVYNIEVHSCGVFHAGNVKSLLASDEKTSPLITSQDFDVLKEKLQMFYKNLTLPCIAWLDDAEDLDIGEFFIDLKLDESGKSIKKEDIFNLVNQQRTTRILIEGQPGSGKTSLATRIIYDWANEEGYVDQFQLAFLLPLRQLQQRSIIDAIKSIGNICGFKDSDLIDEIIAHNEQHILFILDGLDELSVEDRVPILKLLYKQNYSEVTMLVTCRTGLFTLTKDERSQLFEGVNRQSTFYNKKISILGIKNDEKKIEFLEKFIITDENIKENIVADLKSTVGTTELFDCPLFLILLAFIVNTEEENVGIVLTTTELYKKLFSSIIKHNCVKNRIPLDDCFDLFDYDPPPNDLRELIRKFGELSLQHILANNLQFKSDSLTQQIYKVGFLCNYKQVMRFKSNQYYEAFHLSILEFSAAYYVWTEYKSNKFEFMEKILVPVVQHYLKTRGTSLVLGFMIGLFQEHAGDIIDGIQPFSSCFCLNFHYVAQLIKECSSPDVYKKVFPFMTLFLPVHLDLRMRFRLEMLHLKSFEKLIKYGIKCGKIKSVYVSNLIQTPCILKLHFPCLKTRLEKTEDLPNILTHLQSKVNELHIDISEATKNSKLSTADIKKFVSTLATFKSKTCVLKLYCYDAAYMNPQLCVQLKESTFENPFYIFSIRIETDSEKLFAITLLQKNQITFLQVYLPSHELDPSDLFKAIAESTNLHSFMLDSNPANRDMTVIDLCDLTNGGTKKFEYLEFKNCIVNCRQSLIDRNCICIFSINGISRVKFQNIEPINLHCRMSHVMELLEMNPTWLGVNSITYISIRESNACEIEDKRVFEFLSTCRNLQILEISSTIFKDACSLVEGLQQLAIEKFVYSFESFKNLNLFKTMNDNWIIDNYKLQSIDIIYKWESLISSTQSRNCVSLELLELLKGLQKQHWKRVNFVCYGRDTFLSLLNDKNVIDVSIFNVVHYLYGSDNDDPDYHKFLSKRNAFSNVNAFAITLK